LTLTNCRILDNTTTAAHGGGLFATTGSSTLHLIDCQVARNRTLTSGFVNLLGGGLYLSGNSRLLRCTVTDNEASGYQQSDPVGRGGGIYTALGSAQWRNCVISGNTVVVRAAGGSSYPTSAHGGGAYVASGSLDARNCILADNKFLVTKGAASGHRGGGIFAQSGTVNVENCTIARNQREGINRTGGTVQIRNSILYFNNGNGTQVAGTVTIDYSCLQNWASGGTNISYNPAFAEATCEMILPGSPCIDAGDSSIAYDDRCHQGTHPFGPALGTARNDIGAHGGPGACDWNRPGTGIALAVSPDPVVTPGPVTFTVHGGDPRTPVALFWVGESGVPVVPPRYLGLLGSICPARNTDLHGWQLVVQSPKLFPTSLSFRAYALSANLTILESNDFQVTFQ
jgi:hypothetical protein